MILEIEDCELIKNGVLSPRFVPVRWFISVHSDFVSLVLSILAVDVGAGVCGGR